ncbi:MAG: Na+/H+ antiporter subunit E [Alphaproteobacteria bacterium]|nr:Na+/H+ antiporter subunit E [Alphaproteobacteria bacterium]
MKLFILTSLVFFALVSNLSYESIAKSLFFSALSLWIYSKFFSHLSNKISIKLSPKLILYIFWLLKEVLVSAFSIIGIVIFKRSKNIRPVLKTLKVKTNDTEGTIYGNSITITPGTLTTKIDDSSLKIHSISNSHYENLVQSKMLSKIQGSQR